MRIAPPVVLDASQQETLKQWAGSRSLPARQVERAKVVLLAAAGRTDLEIATVLRITNQKAARWRKRFLRLVDPFLEPYKNVDVAYSSTYTERLSTIAFVRRTIETWGIRKKKLCVFSVFDDQILFYFRSSGGIISSFRWDSRKNEIQRISNWYCWFDRDIFDFFHNKPTLEECLQACRY